MYKTPQGFSFSTTSLGLKQNKSDDFVLITTDKPAACAAVFTQNTCLGAPVVVSKEHLNTTNTVKAILINAGIANVATGEKGIEDAKNCAQMVAKNLRCKTEEVLVSSTGIIGHFLVINNMIQAIPLLVENQNKNIEHVAKAIMTTDTVHKIAEAQCGNASIVGVTKGAGMIAPNMATTLTFIMTDANIPKEKLQIKWKEIIDKTFNMMSIDNCESTSDMAIVLANGYEEVDENEFFEKLYNVAESLTKQLVRDGEGATTLIECNVNNCDNQKNAQILAKSVINSDLVKTAIHGKDPNWGRIVQALGGTYIPIDFSKITISLDKQIVFSQGRPNEDFDISQIFQNEECIIDIDCHSGNFSAKAWGCDLSKEYITINADYHT